MTPYFLNAVMEQIIGIRPSRAPGHCYDRISLAKQLLCNVARVQDEDYFRFAPLGLTTGIMGIAMLGAGSATVEFLEHMVLKPWRLRPH